MASTAIYPRSQREPGSVYRLEPGVVIETGFSGLEDEALALESGPISPA